MTISRKRRHQQSSLEKAWAMKKAKHSYSDNKKIREENEARPLTPNNMPGLLPDAEKFYMVHSEPPNLPQPQPTPPPAPALPTDLGNSSDSEGDSNIEDRPPLGWQSYYRPPTIAQAEEALKKLDSAVRTPLPSGGYKYQKLDRITAERITSIKACLNQFLNADPKGQRFIEASMDAARMQGRGAPYARTIRKWARHLILMGNIPGNTRGWWNVSTLEDEDVSFNIKLHLQRVGKYACAKDIVDFLHNPEVRARLEIKKKISLRTAQRWLLRAGFRWKSEPKGQYFDGHEREDVVKYRETIYIPFLKALEHRRVIYNQHGIPDPTRPIRLLPGEKPVIFWFHDESIFYANDRRLVRWVYIGEHPTPFKKGEGCSIMIADFVCPELGWLRGRNGESARVVMFPGGEKDGWFTNDRVVLQLRDAIKIVEKNFPQFTHVFVYDNAPSHTKHSPSSLTAQGMPKGPVMDWPYYKNEDGERIFVRMQDGQLPDGSTQSFYDPNEPTGRRFKGMAWILRERGLGYLAQKNAVCAKGCEASTTNCCCRRVMANQPDFKSRDSTLQETGRQLGALVIFLPKYHCELSLIEQIWGMAKRFYRDMPPSSNPKVLKANALKAVELVPLLSMRKFGARSQRFVDGYHSGMNGSEAIEWATKQFRHHRETPAHIPYERIAPGYVYADINT